MVISHLCDIGQVVREDGETEMVASATVTAGLSPQHKAAVVLFLERVYGVQDQITFYRMLENAFLPDLRAATTLEEVSPSLVEIVVVVVKDICKADDRLQGHKCA